MLKKLWKLFLLNYYDTFEEVDDELLLGGLVQTHTYMGRKLRLFLWTEYTLVKKDQVMLATQEDGIELCRLIHKALIDEHLYPALTGGLLYKDGPRKDIDIVIYRNRQKLNSFDLMDYYSDFKKIGVELKQSYGFVTKAEWKGFSIDLFNPESDSGFY